MRRRGLHPDWRLGATLTCMTHRGADLAPKIVREAATVQGDSESSRPGQEPDRREQPREMSVDREILRLARRGEVHPDPQVAAHALAWAKIVLAKEPMQPEAYGRKQSRFVVELAGLWGEGNAGPMMIDRMRRRNAENIIRASARHSVGQDPADSVNDADSGSGSSLGG